MQLLTEAGASPHKGATNSTRRAPQEQKEKTRKKKTKTQTQTNSGQDHKEKDPRKATHILREKEKKRSAIHVGNQSGERLGVNFWGVGSVGSVGNVGSVGKSMIFQHSQCFQYFQYFQCSKKRGTPLKIPPYCGRSPHQTHKVRKKSNTHGSNKARQGQRHSAGVAHKLCRAARHGKDNGTAQG